jgi:hypothetical protein
LGKENNWIRGSWNQSGTNLALMRLRLWVAQTNVVVLMVHLELLYKPAAISRGKTDGRLVVISNRVPLPSSSVAPAAGGLAVALRQG